jgi:hypothetical protein
MKVHIVLKNTKYVFSVHKMMLVLKTLIFCAHLGQITVKIPGTPLSRLWKPAPCCRQACSDARRGLLDAGESLAIIPTPSQTVIHLFRLFRPPPETTPKSICSIAWSLAPSGLITAPRGKKQLVAVFPEPTGTCIEKKTVRKAIVCTVHIVYSLYFMLSDTWVCTECSWQNVHTA